MCLLNFILTNKIRISSQLNLLVEKVQIMQKLSIWIKCVGLLNRLSQIKSNLSSKIFVLLYKLNKPTKYKLKSSNFKFVFLEAFLLNWKGQGFFVRKIKYSKILVVYNLHKISNFNYHVKKEKKNKNFIHFLFN